MKAHNSIDDMFQQHFAETTVPMNNQEELWARISKPKKDRRAGYWWKGFIGFALVGLMGWTLAQYNNNASDSTSLLTINKTQPYNNPIPSENKETIIPAENQNQEITEAPNSTTILKKELNPIPTTTISKSKINDNINVKNSTNSTLIKTPNQTSKFTGNTSAELLINNSKSISITENDQINLFQNIDNIGSSSLQFVKSTTQKPFKINQSDSWSRCEVKTPGHFFVDAYGQGGLPLDEIGFSQTGADQDAYRSLWETRFTPKASWHGGLAIGYQLRNGLRISAGAEYQEIVTEYADNQQVTEIIRVWDPQAFFIEDPNGERVWVGDTVTAINIYDRKFVVKNTHQLLHIPLQLGYDIYKKPSFHIGLNVAAALNISKSYEGQFIRSDQTLVVVDNSNEENYFSKDIGVSLDVGLHFGYYKNDNLEFYASPRFRFNPNSYLLNTETLKITRNVIGLRGGIRYHF